MDYANILVWVDLDAAAADRIRLAAGLAQRFSAKLTGAAAHKVPAPILVHDILDAQQQEAENEETVRGVLEQARALFDGAAAESARTDWRAAFAGSVEQTRAADLVVVGRRCPEDEPPNALGVPPGHVLMEAGRPVLVVPPRTASLRAARIVVAWKDGAEARRAVAAALPFIRDADAVFVASTGERARH